MPSARPSIGLSRSPPHGQTGCAAADARACLVGPGVSAGQPGADGGVYRVPGPRGVDPRGVSVRPPADESKVPELFNGLTYGSAPIGQAQVSTEGIGNDIVAARIGTGPQVAELVKGGVGNIMNPEWQAEVANAVKMNGGLGQRRRVPGLQQRVWVRSAAQPAPEP